MSLLEVNHIDVHYGDFLALKDVSIHVEPGTIPDRSERCRKIHNYEYYLWTQQTDKRRYYF